MCLGAAPGDAPAPLYRAGHIEVSRLHATPTPPTASVAAVYLWITNSGTTEDRLVKVSSPIAARADVHATSMTQGIMQMRQMQTVEVPAGAPLKLEPGGLHIMLQGLKEPLRAGSAFPLTLEFRDAGMLTVQVPVEAME